MSKKAVSAGVFLYCYSTNRVLLYHEHETHWGFPKGHQEEGESLVDTAARELQEEVNINLWSLKHSPREDDEEIDNFHCYHRHSYGGPPETKEIHLLPMLCSTTRKGEYKKWAKRAEQNDGKWVHIRNLHKYLWRAELYVAEEILHAMTIEIAYLKRDWGMADGDELLAHHVYCLCEANAEHGFKEETVTITNSEYKLLKRGVLASAELL